MLVGEEIRKLREERGMTQAELAEGLATSSYISYIERTNSMPSRRILEAIAHKLSVSVAFFDAIKAHDSRTPVLIQLERLKALLDLKEYARAQELSDHIEAETLPEHDTALMARFFLARGILHHRLGDRVNALASFRKAHALAEELGHTVGQVESLYWLGTVHRERHELQLALQSLRSANGLAAEGPLEPELSYQVQLGLALTLQQIGDYGEVNKIYEGLILAMSELNHENRATLLLGLSQACFDSADFEQALEYAVQARSLAEKDNALALIANAEAQMAEGLIRQNKFTDALPLIQRALSQQETMRNNGAGVARLHLMRARVEMSLQRFREAEEYVQKALKLDWKVHNKDLSPAKGEAYAIRAHIQKEERYLSEAKNGFENAARVFQSCEMYGAAADQLKHAADITLRLDEPIKAYNLLSQALELARRATTTNK